MPTSTLLVLITQPDACAQYWFGDQWAFAHDTDEEFETDAKSCMAMVAAEVDRRFPITA